MIRLSELARGTIVKGILRNSLHQITAVYGKMITRQPLRFLLADDPLTPHFSQTEFKT